MDATTRQALEAILFVAAEPVDLSTLAQVLEVDRREVEAELRGLQRRLEAEDRGFVLRCVAGGWRLYTAPPTAPYIERWVAGERSTRLSAAALETLAIIAYRQPISRQEVGSIRGVNPDAAVRTLVARGLVDEVGRDPGPGQAILYGTTTLFLEKLGLGRIEDLPPITDFLPEGPAPDEPSPEELPAVRARLRAGEGMASAGGGDDAVAARGVGGAATGALDALTDELEQAARSAMAALDAALTAMSDDGRGETSADEGPRGESGTGRPGPGEGGE